MLTHRPRTTSMFFLYLRLYLTQGLILSTSSCCLEERASQTGQACPNPAELDRIHAKTWSLLVFQIFGIISYIAL